MRRVFLSLMTLGVLLGGQAWVCAQNAALPAEKQTAQGRKRGGLITLYALDPLLRSFCFGDGREGMAFVNNRWSNRCSDVSYSLAGDGVLVSGIEATRVASMIDLGTPDQLREKYGYDDAVGGGEGFASLRLEGERIMILKEDNPNEVFQPLLEGAKLFSEVIPSANLPIKLGHIYLVRIADKRDRSFQWIAKLMVVAYRPDEAVTLRWELL